MTQLTPKFFANGLFLALAVTTYYKDARAFTVRELYEKALVHSELVQSSQLDVKITESDKDRLRATVRPKVSLDADAAYQVNKFDKENWGNNKVAGVRTEFRQPLYDGGTSSAALDIADANIKAYQWDVKTQEQDLYLRVATLFYDWIAQNQDIKNLEEAILILERRVKDLGERTRIGRSRDAEVYSARTQLELTRGMIAEARTNRNASEEELAWLANVPVPLVLDDNLDLTKIRPKIRENQNKSDPAQADYKLPTVEAAEARILAAEKAIDLTRTDLKPRLDFIAQHQWSYLDPSDQGVHDLSFGLGLTWLIYDSGQVNAAVTTASLIKNKATVQKELADREGQLFLGIATRRLEDSLAQIASYDAALKVVDRTLGVQRQEYDSGLITNLELLTTLDQRLEIRRNLDLALNRAKLVYVQTEIYSGNWLKKESL